MATYFIGDMHVGHKNVLKFDSRPFKSIEEHDNFLFDNWNNLINDDDDVYILGDFSWTSPSETVKYFEQLKGNKHLIVGNHDSKLLKNAAVRKLFVEIKDRKELRLDDKTTIILDHYPSPCFKNHMRGWYHLYAHVHNSAEWDMMEEIRGNFESKNIKCEMYNVGCMMTYINYKPRTLQEIIDGYKNL